MEKGMVVGGVVLAVASALVIYTNWRFIWRAVLFWGVCFGKRNQKCVGVELMPGRIDESGLVE